MNTACHNSENAELEASLRFMHVSDCRLSYGRGIRSEGCQTRDASWVTYTTFAARGKRFLVVVTWLRKEGRKDILQGHFLSSRLIRGVCSVTFDLGFDLVVVRTAGLSGHGFIRMSKSIQSHTSITR